MCQIVAGVLVLINWTAMAGAAAAGMFQISSPSFKQGEPIPSQFTCDGKSISPALDWTNAPAGTRSFAIIVDDPDAPSGTWVHWVYYNVPSGSTGARENFPRPASPPQGGSQGVNSFKKVGYDGPCPPGGSPHRYYFRLYALDTLVQLKPKATRSDLDAAMEGHILGQAELMGTYRRKD
jgi:Raf kinase inhibitor-like YbhB/YbcL family protein